ncbi:DGQHR domain-containing protein [Salmonella enterica subsp. enterica serovar Berta]|nr:DGQHR domain-containing protein [Salmonella enterica subsp. enterica serovar Berta]
MSLVPQEYTMDFPATVGMQGKTLILFLTIPGRILSRVLSSDSLGHALERSQRELNKKRAKKFHDYLVSAMENETPFIIPPLVGNCDSFVEYETIGNTNVGMAKFPMDAVIKLFDGQHRAKGIIDFCSAYRNDISVPIMLTQQLPLKTRQQFFSDINNNVSKPAAAINMVYNGRDDLAQQLVAFLRKHHLFSALVDFEHNVVPAKSFYWISFKAICDATQKFIGDGDTTLSPEAVSDIWNAWLNLTALEEIRVGTAQAEYKKDYIQFHAVMINAFGFAVQRLREAMPVDEVVTSINTLAIETDTWQKEEFFLIKNWGGICANTEKENPTVIARVSAQKAAAEKLVDAIKRKSM